MSLVARGRSGGQSKQQQQQLQLQHEVHHLTELFNSHSSYQHLDRYGELSVWRAESKQALTGDRHYRQCLCQLRGNLLLIRLIASDGNTTTTTTQSSLHSIANSSTTITAITNTVIVLSNFEVILCQESKHYEFCIINKRSAPFEQYYFICNSRADRDKWVESIYLASFDFLRKLYQVLADDWTKLQNKCVHENSINAKSVSSHVSRAVHAVQQQQQSHDEHFLAIQCHQLALLGDTIEPAVFVKLFCRHRHLSQRWHYLGCTEFVCSRSPAFNTHIRLGIEFGQVELKFELHKVVQFDLDISCLVAFAYFLMVKPFGEQQPNLKVTYKVTLKSAQNHQPFGKISFRVEKISCSKSTLRYGSLSELDRLNKLKEERRLHSWLSSPNLLAMNNIDNNQSLCNTFRSQSVGIFANRISKQFSFPLLSHYYTDVTVHESMFDTKYVFLIPQILMKLYAQDEENVQTLLHDFYAKHSVVYNILEQLPMHHQRMVQLIKESLLQTIDFMSSHSFRASKLKKETFLQFVPINFHKQVCRVRCNPRGEESSIQIYTTGAYACHHLGFDKQGMQSMLASKHENPLVIDCWILLKKLLIVMNCESMIKNLISQMFHSNDEQPDLCKLEKNYNIVHNLANQLIDLVSASQVDSLLSDDHLAKLNLFVDELQLEPIELVYLNIKACLVAFSHRMSQKQVSLSELDSCNRKLKTAIESLRKTVFICYLSIFQQLSNEQADLLYQIRFRHLSIFTQALTTLITFIIDRLGERDFLVHTFHTRYVLVQHEVLLSCFSDEIGMLEDMTYALEEVANSVLVVFTFENVEPQSLLPDIDMFGDKIRLHFHLKQDIAEIYLNTFECKIMSLVFNIGFNEQATLADKFGMNALQNDINEINYHKLKAFITQFYPDHQNVSLLVGKLKAEIPRHASKNISILRLVEHIVHEIHGIRVTCCKSAKDRTGMAVTLEEVRFVFDICHLHEDKDGHLLQDMLNTIRSNGTRIENAYKNIGRRKYAFNRLQIATFPSKLRPPSGTYCTLET